MKAKIYPNNSFGGLFSDDFPSSADSNYTNILPSELFIQPIWNGYEWIEGATFVEIEAHLKLKVPHEISRMNFIIQVFIVTSLKYEDIVTFIQNLPQQYLDDASKYIVLTKLRGCVFFERYSEDLLMIAQMMNITSEQLDQIFINGNS